MKNTINNQIQRHKFRVLLFDKGGAEVGEVFCEFQSVKDALFCGPDTEIEYEEARLDMDYREAPDAPTTGELAEEEERQDTEREGNPGSGGALKGADMILETNAIVEHVRVAGGGKLARPRPEWVRGKCPQCGDDLVSNCYYVAGRSYIICWECWGSLSAAPTCSYRHVL